MTIHTLLSDYRSTVEEIISDAIGFPVTITDEMIRWQTLGVDINVDVVVRGRTQHYWIDLTYFKPCMFNDTLYYFKCVRFSNNYKRIERVYTGYVVFTPSADGCDWHLTNDAYLYM